MHLAFFFYGVITSFIVQMFTLNPLHYTFNKHVKHTINNKLNIFYYKKTFFFEYKQIKVNRKSKNTYLDKKVQK